MLCGVAHVVYPILQAWPPMNAVEELAGKIHKIEKKGARGRFILADLKKSVRFVLTLCSHCVLYCCRFLPAFCPDYKAVETDHEEAGDKEQVRESLVKLLGTKDAAPDKPKKSEYKLQLPFWLAAWDSYALAAAVLGQMQYKAALQHKLVVQEVAADASAGGRKQLLGVIYDEVARYGCCFLIASCLHTVCCTGRNGRNSL